MEGLKAEKERKISLYVHLPFCAKKCAYCDFTSYAGREAAIPRYLTLLLGEWEAIQNGLFREREVSVATGYVGGGTPSLLEEDQVGGLMRRLFPDGPDPDMELTIEANPESLTVSKLACYREVGINRLSVGIQSFSDEMLRRLGRIHSARRSIEVLEMIAESGWENFNVDLMYGLPGQSPSDFADDIDQALRFTPPHLSAYCLTLHPGTPLGRSWARGMLALPTEDDILRMMDILEDKMGAAGYDHYEVSNFARRGYACRHNLAYWTLSPYIGLGVGAVSYVTEAKAPWGCHWENPRSLEAYARHARRGTWAFTQRTPLSKREALMESLLAGMRLSAGIPMDTLAKRFGRAVVTALGSRAEPLVANGWLSFQGGTLKATHRGSALLDTLILELIPDF